MLAITSAQAKVTVATFERFRIRLLGNTNDKLGDLNLILTTLAKHLNIKESWVGLCGIYAYLDYNNQWMFNYAPVKAQPGEVVCSIESWFKQFEILASDRMGLPMGCLSDQKHQFRKLEMYNRIKIEPLEKLLSETRRMQLMDRFPHCETQSDLNAMIFSHWVSHEHIEQVNDLENQKLFNLMSEYIKKIWATKERKNELAQNIS